MPAAIKTSVNVLFITHTWILYGANRSLLGLIEKLIDFGISPVVITRKESSFSGILESMKIPVYIVPFPLWFREDPQCGDPDGGLACGDEHDCADLACQVIAKHNIRLIYTNSVMTDFGARLANRMRIQHLWHLREFADLDYDWTPIQGWNYVSDKVRSANTTISVSDAVRSHILGRNVRDVDLVVFNGVVSQNDLGSLREKRKLRRHKNAQGKPFTFALVGLIRPSKGQTEAVLALSNFSGLDIRLTIAGDGEIEVLREEVDRLGLSSRVDIKGYVKDPFGVFMESDAALMCSRHEAFGRVTAEAMAAGLPVIGRDTGGTKELILHGRTGLLYQGGANNLAMRMGELYHHREWANSMGDQAQDRAFSDLTTERYAASIFRILRHVVARETLDKPTT